MELEQVCRKKDKRLLVLLALGALILLSDIDIPATAQSAASDHFWLEIRGGENRLYRIAPSVHSDDSIVNRLVGNGENIPAAVRKRIFNERERERAVTLDTGREGSALLPAPVSPRLAFFLGQPFSINIAGFDDLTLVPGIGPVLAGNIIAHREKHGPVTEPHRLEDIPGIGPRMRHRLQNYLTCSIDRE